MQDFLENFRNDAKVKIPWVRRDLCSQRVLVMEWINGRRCTDPRGIRSSGLDVNNFIRGGVVSALRQLLEVGAVLCASSTILVLSRQYMHGCARECCYGA